MGVIARGAKCDVSGCGNDGVRSLNARRVDEAGIRLSTPAKKAVLCRDHYREWKKETKGDRDLERARYGRS